MQIFTASFDLKENAKFLDGKRLFKQTLENFQILNTLITGKGWVHHPAVRQFKGHEFYLSVYFSYIWEECVNRGIAKDSKLPIKVFDLIVKLTSNKEYNSEPPNWWGREDIAASHRSRLRCKGLIDAACTDIKRDLKLKSIDRWLKEKFGLAKNALKYKHLDLLLQTSGVEFKTPSHYEQFGWTEDPAGEYIWPI